MNEYQIFSTGRVGFSTGTAGVFRGSDIGFINSKDNDMTATEILAFILTGDYIGLLLAVLTEIFRVLASFGV